MATIFVVSTLLAVMAGSGDMYGQGPEPTGTGPEKVIIDTDIGDDIDDAFALALALSNKDIKILGVTTAWGDTDLRARLVERLLKNTDHEDILVAAGPKTASRVHFTQAAWAEAFPEPAGKWPDAVDFILGAIRQNPGEITLISLAPLSNVGAAIDRDPATFRQLKRVVIMGGSIGHGPGAHDPTAEYNIYMDIPAAKKLFASTVPIDMMPIDVTQMHLDWALRSTLLRNHTPVTDTLNELYLEWARYPNNVTPTLFDGMAVAAAINPSLCPTTPMHIRIDDAGITRVQNGAPNANVCLHSNPDEFFHFYQEQVLAANAGSQGSTAWAGWDMVVSLARYLAASELRW